MKEIKNLLEKKGKIENARKGLVTLLDTSLKVLKKVARNHIQGQELYEANNNYLLIYAMSKKFLPKEESERFRNRYRKIQKIWTEIKNEKKI